MQDFLRWKAVYTLIFLLLPFILTAQTTRYVPSQYATIADAISASSNGDTIDIIGNISEYQINITKNLVIRGHGITNTIVSCSFLGGCTGVFSLAGGNTAYIKDMTIQDGNNGIMAVNGNLSISNCYIHNNLANGISNDGSSGGGNINISNCEISNNTRGVYIRISGTTTISYSNINNNNATRTTFNYGGGIYNEGTMQVSYCTISNNELSGGTFVNGAGIWNTGNLQVSNCTISNNQLTGTSSFSVGAGIYSINKLILNNSTVNMNILNGKNNSHGAGIYVSDTAIINNSTISNNVISSTGFGSNSGGIYGTTPSLIKIKNTILAGNIVNGVNNSDYGGGNIISYGHNLIGQSNAPVFNATGDIKGQNPMLDILKDNGGPTATLALLNGSPAINAGSNTDIDGNPVTRDQRNFQRVNVVDIGSYEWDGIYITTKQISDNICNNRQDQAILKIELILHDTFTVNSFRFNTSGTSYPSDILNAKLYYSGNVNNFSLSTSTQYGATVNLPSGNFQINGNIVLSPDTNYFWLIYDISTAASTGNSFDAYCPQIILRNTARIPDDTMPSGNRTIPQVNADFQINDSAQCLTGNSLVFTNHSTTTSGNLTSLWDFGDHSFSSIYSVTHNYITPDTFNIKLTVIANGGCSDSIAKAVIVFPEPKAYFVINNPVQCLNVNQFIFTDSSTISNGSIAGKNWDLGDGHLDTSSIITHKYLNFDSFAVKLKVTSNMGCSDSIINIVTVKPVLEAKFIAYDSSQCLERNNFAFTNKSSSVNSSFNSLWNFGDSLISTLYNPTHKYNYADTFTVTLIVTDTFGCKDTFSKNTWVHVHPEPIAAFSINDSSQCFKRNNFICLNNSTIKSGTFLQQWQFGDGFDTVSFNASHRYKTVDSFLIKLLIKSDWGCKDSILKKVIVNPEQTSSFNLSDSNVCVGETISFTNTSSNNTGVLSYLWDFGDGDTSHAPEPQHSYKTDGTFKVLLITVNNSRCIDSAYHKVTVFSLPAAGFTIDNNIQCLRNNNFKLTNNSLPGSSLASFWDFGDGTYAISKDTSHIYSKPDSFYIKLITTSLQGCKDSMVKLVFVKPDQITAFTLSDTDVCIGVVINFNNSSSYNYGTLTFQWDFGDGNSTGTSNPQYSYSTDSTYDIKLVSINNFGCKDSISQKVYVNPLPKTDFAINDTIQCLTGNSFTFTNNSSIKSGSIIQNYFDLGDGTNSLLSPVNHNYAVADTFLVTLKSKSDRGCTDSITKIIYIRPMPTAGFTINSKTQNLAGNYFVYTSTSVIPSGNLKYYWDFGDGNNSTASNPTHVYSLAGSFKVVMIATSDFGCADTFSDSVFVFNYPKMHVSFTVQNACVGEDVLFKNTSTVSPSDSFLNFLWDFGDGTTIILKEPKHIYASAGTYFISLAVLTAFGSKDTLIDTIEIFADPVVNITASPDTIVIPGSPVTLTATGLYDQLLWFDNSTASSVMVTSEGKYWITASYINGCKSSDTITLTKGEFKKPELVNAITPNGDGINDKLVIKNIDSIKPCKLSIYNRWGDELFATSDYQNNWDGKYKGKTLPEGTYYYVLVAKDGKLYKGAVNILK